MPPNVHQLDSPYDSKTAGIALPGQRYDAARLINRPALDLFCAVFSSTTEPRRPRPSIQFCSVPSLDSRISDPLLWVFAVWCALHGPGFRKAGITGTSGHFSDCTVNQYPEQQAGQRLGDACTLLILGDCRGFSYRKHTSGDICGVFFRGRQPACAGWALFHARPNTTLGAHHVGLD